MGCGSDDQTVYALRAKKDEFAPVKFGTTTNLTNRLRGIMTGSPYPLAVLAEVPGGVVLERAIHKLLAPWRSNLEWFCGPDGECTTFARQLKSESFRRLLMRWDAVPDLLKSKYFDHFKITPEDFLKTYVCDRNGIGLAKPLLFLQACADLFPDAARYTETEAA